MAHSRRIATLMVVITSLWYSRARSDEPLFIVTDSPQFVVTTATHSSDKLIGEAAPTPMAEVVRVIGLLPTPQIGFVDWGCGDGRWCIAAAEKWPTCRVTGVEIDNARAAATRERVRAAGLENRITIVTGDVLTVPVEADVGTCFLYQSTLDALRPRLEKMRAWASYRHRPTGLPCEKSGDSWIYIRPVQQAVVRQPYAVWNGQIYYGPNPGCNCEMCRSIISQIAAQQQAAPVAAQPKAASGHWETVKRCNGKSCWFEQQWIAD